MLLVAVVVLGAVLGGAAATQSVAAAYRYHPSLSWRLGEWGGRVWYAPWAFFVWKAKLGARDPAVFAAGLRVAQLPVLLLLGLVAAGVRWAMSKRGSDTHGTARWATRSELKRRGLLDDGNGVVLCQTAEARFNEKGMMVKAGTIIKDDNPGSTIVVAGTRSGKGVGCVIPSAVNWIHSILILDVKKEIYEATSGFRGQFGPVIRFEPTAPDSAAYNPLAEIRPGLNEVRDAQAVATMLVDPTGEKEPDHWQKTAFTLLTGAILHVLYAEEDKSLRGVATFLTNPKCSQFDTLDKMLSTNHLPSGPHPIISECAKEIMNKAEQELSGVFSTATAALGLYRDPVVARATSRSDFRIADLMHGKRPLSLYLVVAPSDIDRLRPLMRLVLDQIGRRLIESNAAGGGAKPKHRLLLLLDEVAILGRVSFIEQGLPVFAGYGIKAFLVLQSILQLEAKYTDKQSLVSNCAVRLIYSANEENTAERISKWTGQATKTTENVSMSGSVFGPKNQASHSKQETQRSLLTPGEVMTLPDTDALLFVQGMQPYRAKKVRFYCDPRFKARTAMPSLKGDEEMKRRLPAPSVWEEMAAEAKKKQGAA
jgi:type IV secretion system protein VirD4